MAKKKIPLWKKKQRYQIDHDFIKALNYWIKYTIAVARKKEEVKNDQ